MSETNEETPNASETEQSVEEKKKNKKPLIIGGILGGVAVIAIGAIILSTTGNGGIIPIDKSYTTAIIDGKEYKNTNTIAIVDGVEVSDIAKLASLTENTNKEAYICRSTWAYQGGGDMGEGNIELNPNTLPVLYWSNVVNVPKEYQLSSFGNIITGNVRIALPKPELEWKVLGKNDSTAEISIIDETTGKAGEESIVENLDTVDGYDYKCGMYSGFNSPSYKAAEAFINGVWEEQNKTYTPIPEQYKNWYSEYITTDGLVENVETDTNGVEKTRYYTVPNSQYYNDNISFTEWLKTVRTANK